MRSLQVMCIEELGKLVEALPSVKEVPLDFIWDGSLHNADRYKALVNERTGYLESVVSEKYTVVQHKEAFGTVVNTLQEECPDAKLRAAVLTDKGRAYMSVVFCDQLADDGAAGIELGFTVANSYDKSSAVHYGGTVRRFAGHFELFALRLTCGNGMTVRVQIPDWNGLIVKERAEAQIGDIVGISPELVEDTHQEEGMALSFRHVGRVDRKLEGVSMMLSVLPGAAARLGARVRELRNAPMDVFKARERLKEMEFGPRITQRIVEGFAGEEATEWGLLNAITDYASHNARVSPRRMEEMLVQARVVV